MIPRARHIAVVWAAALLVAVSGCAEDSEPVEPADLAPLVLDDQEDPVCGMLVRNQSAPRGQVRHRDGTRFAFCSLADLLVHLSAPSRHGEVTHVMVEVLEPEEDPNEAHRQPHPWVDAADATYVIGIPRPGIMGAPILSYRTPEAAARVARDHAGARSLDFAALERWWAERDR